EEMEEADHKLESGNGSIRHPLRRQIAKILTKAIYTKFFTGPPKAPGLDRSTGHAVGRVLGFGGRFSDSTSYFAKVGSYFAKVGSYFAKVG
ncbi:hypothetical protein KOM00_12930, partial [Geomonas sp. Red69]|uniref:hypothetical protein n=1 Tax=Geomonas diazotrophica TaxID=2843197 RepID=UPI001C101BE2